MIAAMRSSTLALPLLALVGVLAGCPDGPDGDGPPCDDDVNGCADDGMLVEDPVCELTGVLELELGEGQEVYSPLADGQMPEVFNGFQGGQHIWLGVRVKNPDLERASLRIDIELSDCETDCGDPQNWSLDNDRTLVVGSRTITVTEAGWFEEEGMLVTLENWGVATHRRVEMVVTDPCGRQGLALVTTWNAS
jgi:hypothetical protein